MIPAADSPQSILLVIAGSHMDVSSAIRTKRAVRDFDGRPLQPEEVMEILNAGRRAQSSKNEQSWHFIAVQDRSLLAELSTCGTWAGHLAGAALGVAVITPDPTAKFQTMFDAGQAAAYMQLAAWAMGIGSCPASIYDTEKPRQLLGFPPALHLRVMLSFGYPANPERLSAEPKKGGRRSLADVVHMDRW
jgi:nitroreductase